MRAPILVAAVLAALAVGCAPAVAVIGGASVDPARYPYIVRLPTCTGTLIARDRVLTVAHCVASLAVGDVISFPNGEERHVARVAQDYDYFRGSVAHPLDSRVRPHDVGVLALDAPITDVAPVRLATKADAATYAPGSSATTLGYGITVSNDSLARRELHSGAVEVRSDRTCRSLLTPLHAAGEFDAATMLCTTDPDKRKPFVSGCRGDSGGPLVVTVAGADLEVGLDAWGVHCGTADGDPENYEDVASLHAFAASRSPAWAPVAQGTGLPTVQGTVALGHTASCVAPSYTDPQPKLRYMFTDGGFALTGWLASRRFVIRRDLAGVHLSCRVRARTRGGEAITGDAPSVSVARS